MEAEFLQIVYLGTVHFSECQKPWFLAFWFAVCIITNAVTAKFKG